MRLPDDLIARMALLAPLTVRDFRLLWTGMTVSLFGDGAFFVALAWQTYALSDSPAALSAVALAWTLPMTALLLFGGVASDRFDRRRVMIVGDVIRGGAVAAMGILSLTGSLRLGHLVALAAVYGVGEALFTPAFRAIVPQLLPQEMLLQGNSLGEFVRPIGERLAGPAIGGVLVATVGAGVTFLVDAATFVVSTVALALMAPRPPQARDSLRTARRDALDALAFVRSRPWLWGVMAALGLSVLLILGPFDVLLPYVVKHRMGGPRDLGLIYAAGAIGSIGVSLVLGGRASHRGVRYVLATMAVAFGLVAPYAVVSDVWQAMAIEFVGWAAFTAAMIVWVTLVQTHVPEALLGRVMSLEEFVTSGLAPVSFALVGPVSVAIGVDQTFLWSGLLGAAVCLGFMLLPGVTAVGDPGEAVAASGVAEPRDAGVSAGSDAGL